jgi:molecular chaperone GrpE
VAETIGSNGQSGEQAASAAEAEAPTQGTPAETLEGQAKRVAELEAQLKEKENRYLYLYAEFENFKKRMMKERTDLMKFGWEPVARELLQTADNLDRALAHIPPGTDKNLVEGLRMVQNQFRASLEKQGVQPLTTLKQEFDPNLHEAVGQEPADEPMGTITKELSKGYTLHGRLLRPARVVLSAGKAAANT